MGDQLKCTKLLSLKEMAQRRVVVHLWSNLDVVTTEMIFQLLDRGIKDRRSKEDKIKANIFKLGLPKSLAKQLTDVVTPIGLNISTWKNFHEKTFHFSLNKIYDNNSAKLHFTSAGTIDDRKMAEELVHCKSINIVQRYRIACAYWQEDHIPALWAQLSEEDKENYRRNPVLQGLEYSWPRIFNGRESKLDWFLRSSGRNLTSFKQWAFEHCVKTHFKTTAEYFFQKLTHEEREASVMRCARLAFQLWGYAPNERFYDVFCYMLSLMTPEQKMAVVKSCPLGVLSCFLDWPRQDLFLENADLIWPFLPPRVFGSLLGKVIDRYMEFKNYHENYFTKFFPDFFQQSPLDFKKYFVDEKDGAFLFLKIFFNSDDSESIEVMFRSMNVADRVKLLFQPDVLLHFHREMLRDKWHLVKVCLQEAMLSGIERKRLEETFLRHMEARFLTRPRYFYEEIGTDVLPMNDSHPKLISFFDFLNEPVLRRKRKAEL